MNNEHIQDLTSQLGRRPDLGGGYASQIDTAALEERSIQVYVPGRQMTLAHVIAAPKPIIYSVREKSAQLIGLLRNKPGMKLRELFGLCQSRSELVATFLSVLELCADGQILVTGERGDYNVSERLTEAEA